MRGSVVLACGALVALGACIDIPPKPAGPGDVTTVDYTITLGTGGGQYPVQIIVEGTDVLAPSVTCGDEGGFGIANLPDFTVDGLGPIAGTMAEKLAGPIHKVTLDWMHPACDPANPVLGHTMLTWFPDGHIIRHDTAFQNPGTELNASDCHNCSTDDLWHLSAFAAIADVATMVQGNGSPFSIQDGGTGTTIAGSAMCVTTTAGKRIAFQWPTDNDARARTVTGTDDAFAYDIVNPMDVQNGVSFGLVDSTHMMVATDATPCDELIARLDRFLHAPGDLEINGLVDSTSYQDGIFGSEEEDPYVITDSGPITLHARSEITGGFAVLLQFPGGGPADLVAMGLDAADYLVMAVSNTDRIVWFRAGLAAGADLVLIPP